MRAKKSLGQHFLKSEKALNEIVLAGELKLGETVLEIGPGTGALTEKLLATGVEVLAVEKDDRLYDFLKKKFEGEIANKKLTLVHGDILESNLAKLIPKNYKLVANIPYNITGAILKKFLSEPPAGRQPVKMVLLVQKEVARRIIAQNGKESILSISVKVYGKPRYIDTVKAGSFVPAPKVDSAIIAIENISAEFFRNTSEKGFFVLIHAGFRSKRKKVVSNLATIIDKERVHEILKEIGLDENMRAEDLSLESWKNIAKNL